MAIEQKSLDQRLSSILPAQAPEFLQDDVDVMATESPALDEPVQVAGLGTVLKVIKQATKPAKALEPSAADRAVSEAAQKTVQEAATAVEKTTVPGAVQKVKAALAPEKPARPAAEVQTTPPPPASTEQMQTAIKVAEDAAEVVPPEPAGAIIKIATPEQADKFLSGLDAPAVGIDFNLNYLQTTEDIDRAIDATSKAYATQMDVAKRGVLGDEALKDMAARLNIAPELLATKNGGTLNAEQLLASRHLLVRSAANLDGMATKIKAMPVGTEDDKLLLEFRNALATHAAIQMRLKAAQTETARALRSFRLPVDGATGISDPNQIASLLNEMGGRANMKNLATSYQALSLDQQARFVDLAGSTTQQLGAVWKELYYSSLLLSPAPVERALFGNIAMTLARPFDTFFAATVGRAVDKTIATPLFGSKSSDQVGVNEAFIEIANFFTSLPNALKAGAQAFVTDMPVYKVGRDVDKTPDPAISAKMFADPESMVAQGVDFVGKAVRLWSRGMLAVDEFSKAQLAAMETRRLAAREALIAMDNGVDIDTALDGMAMQITNPDAKTIERVHQGVLEGTLQSDLGSFGNALNKIRNDLGPVGTVIMPFIKTVINAQKQMLARTPVGQLALKEIRDDYIAGGARRQMAMGKAAMGSSFMGLGYYMALEGTITGAGPVDPARRKFLTETTGWQAYSVRTGTDENGKGIYRSYAGLEPVGGMLGMAATLAEVGAVYGKEEDDEWHDLLMYSALLPFKYIGELPFMSSMSNLVNMVEQFKRDPLGEKSQAGNAAVVKFFGGIAQNMVGGVTPVPMPGASSLRMIENMLDPTKRDVTPDPSMPVETKYFSYLFRNWMSKTPLASTATAEDGSPILKPSRNLWGDEIKTGEPGALSFVLPFNKKVRDLDPDEAMFLQIAKARGSMPVNKPENVVANIKLNDAEYSDMLLLMNSIPINGQTLRGALAAHLIDPELNMQMSRGAYEGISAKLSGTVSDYRDAAVASPGFTAMYPDAANQISRNRDLALRQYKRQPREAAID